MTSRAVNSTDSVCSRTSNDEWPQKRPRRRGLSLDPDSWILAWNWRTSNLNNGRTGPSWKLSSRTREPRRSLALRLARERRRKLLARQKKRRWIWPRKSQLPHRLLQIKSLHDHFAWWLVWMVLSWASDSRHPRRVHFMYIRAQHHFFFLFTVFHSVMFCYDIKLRSIGFVCV